MLTGLFAPIAPALWKAGHQRVVGCRAAPKATGGRITAVGQGSEALVLIAGGTPGPGDPALEEALAAIEASRDDYFRVTALSVRVRRGQESPDLAPACLRLLKSPLLTTGGKRQRDWGKSRWRTRKCFAL